MIFSKTVTVTPKVQNFDEDVFKLINKKNLPTNAKPIMGPRL